MWLNLVHAVRHLRRRPVLTIAGIVSLAVGIGCALACASVVNTVLFRALPYHEPNRLVFVWENNSKRGVGLTPVSVLNYQDLKSAATTFDALGAFDEAAVTLDRPDGSERAIAYRTTAGLLDQTHVPPLIGRLFTSAEDGPGSAEVVVLSHGLWQRRFGGDPAIVGQVIRVTGVPHTVIGVMPRGFLLPPIFGVRLVGTDMVIKEADLWVPFKLDGMPRLRDARMLFVLGRLKAGRAVEESQAEASSIGRRLAADYPVDDFGNWPASRSSRSRGHGSADGVRAPCRRLVRAARREPRAPARPAVFDLRAGGAAAAPSGEAAGDAPARLDDDRRGDRVPRSQLRRPVPHQPHRHAHVSARRRHCRAAAAFVTMEVPRLQLAPGYTISRLMKGGWHLAGGHGWIDAAAALTDMDRFVDAGITTFDGADIYTGVEALIGRWLTERPARRASVQIHTKYVPDLDRLATHARADVIRGVDRSLARLGVDRLDLVQLHWWDYDVPGYVDAAAWLDQQRHAGKVRHVGLTNFDRKRMAEIVAAGIPVVSHQVQYSVLDRRPANGLARQCAQHGVGLLCYGALAGGFLSERYLGQPDPAEPLENRSLVKYRLIIDEFGGWDRFQAMLAALGEIASRHGVGIGAVALRWVLDQPSVSAVIVGARHAQHVERTTQAFAFALDDDDRAMIARVQSASSGPDGDTYDLERLKGGTHASIMRYTLGQGSR